ncbi:hypothetical protein C1S86_25570 [Vibrio parahaemolyticus]|uniref:hypothetical protein n=1 Tax=Vibrio parahaemolyticus TaxID=670 RepID=UPI000991EBDB|nr:hypothetical protein [Vibrio parahaemolyticus]EHK0035629.1 hypothetical protein [Vibrio parahaemolyticus]OOQ67373.1 hypothetical protein BSR61_24715 [Vibrio parahaemolyticus]PMT73691.1 hypothetical protein C1S97_26340 [Vibrio parahaemolyticus]PMT78852.1 hypothetical protein C1S86_25570 [Vibrio parahaemolyticus]TOQ83679.1 hypothetical protein CGG87_23540 [Vibrio parahaemolyticus]
MGFSISWIAIKNKNLNQVIDELKLMKSGETEEFPESDISGADLPSGWCHIQFNNFDSPFIKNSVLSKLSENTQVIFSQVEEHVMYSKACCWEKSRLLWSSEHDAQENLEHLLTKGNVPDFYNDIVESYRNMQQGEFHVDYYFEIPLALSEKVTGYKHDASHDDIEYYVLQSINIRKPWWRIW